MIVTSPGCGLVLSFGVYCLIAMCNTSSCVSAVANAYPRMYEQGKVCSVAENICNDMIVLERLDGEGDTDG